MTSKETIRILAEQQNLHVEIEKLYKNFKKDSKETKATPDYVKKKSEILNRSWDIFKENNQKLVDADDIDASNPYFASNDYQAAEQIFDKYTADLATLEQLLATTSSSKSNTNPNNTSGQTTGNGNNNSGSGTSNNDDMQVQNNITKITVLIQYVRNMLDDHNKLGPEQLTSTYLRSFQQDLSSRWKITKKLHEMLATKAQYDIMEFLDLEDRVMPIVMALDISTGNDQGNQYQQQQSNQIENVKLPKISLPRFDGEYSKWKQFSELFQEMIGSKNISGTQKMIYLKQNVVGTAGTLLQHMQLTEDNYDIAWNALQNRYNNQRLIVSTLIENILNIENQKIESAEAIKKMHDTVSENINALERNGIQMDNFSSIIIHHILVKKLDHKTHGLYEQTIIDSRSTQQTNHLLAFLEKRFQALEAIGKVPQASKSQEEKKQKCTSLMISSGGASKPICECAEKHKTFKCPVFLKLSTKERYIKVKQSGSCINCLKEGHTWKECKASKCSECKKKHNTLLHFQKKTALFGSAIKNPDFEHVFLATVVLHVIDNNGNTIQVRAILDSGSQVNVISEKIHNRIGIAFNPTSMTIEGIGTYSVESRKRSAIQIQSMHSSFKVMLEFFVVKNVTTCQPAKKIDINGWKIPNNVQLADPQFNIPARVDMILGGELFYQLITSGTIKIGKNQPELKNTVFGWVVTGKILGETTNKAFSGINVISENTLNQQLEKFWQVEEKYKPAVEMTNAELKCERFFNETTRRDKEGRFIVRLQFKKEPFVLGKSEDMAIRRFLCLEKRFARDAQLKEEYVKFMEEYKSLGHMEEVKREDLEEQHYIIPHHSVLNPASSTTKFRVVFDASMKTTTNISLNEILENGPILQDDLFSIMVRFRKHTYVFSSDIGKMYRQILVDPSERKWQVIVWRKNSTDELKYYKLKTITYGTTCASYEAIKALHEIANIEKDNFPLASKIAKRDFNVDDVMTGTDDLKEAIDLQNQLISMMKLAGMELHKWCANHSMLLENIPKKKQEVSLDINAEKSETKALGMKWIPGQDKFMLHYNPVEHKVITKKTILSETAQLFDPLGIVNPVIVMAKVFMQELWNRKVDWDEQLPENLQQKWKNFRRELIKLNEVAVPRHMILPNATNIQLHAFSDASDRAYGTPIYIRSEDENGNIKVNLVCSKSRVSPTNPLTLPRLELSGAVLMVELVQKLKTVLGINFDEITYWTDSEIVLSWLYNDSTYKTFVANRIATIKRKTDIKDWKYINTKVNPADIISRGVTPENLISSDLWWHGPEFLRKSKEFWPTSKPQFTRVEEEEKIVKTILLATIPEPHVISKIEHGNSIKKLQRIVAYCIKFGSKPARENNIRSARFSIEELDKAMMEIIKYCQHDGLVEDIQYLKKGQQEKTSFSNLYPFIDKFGIVRVGGRLKAANIPYEQKHPAVLPKNHIVTKLIMEKIHIDNMHIGSQGLLATTRQTYWAIHGKQLSKNVIKNCVLCTRAKPKLLGQIMGDLPAERVGVARPFISVGIDFAGPIMIHYKIRGKRPTKAYICIFVCFSTKAVHIEPAADQSTDAFINCLKRFIARRNRPNKIFCDNGGAFVGAKNELEAVANLMSNAKHRERVMEFCEDHRIVWQFIPPRSPHFAGLAEACVKSAKLHLTKILHNISLTFDELATVLAEIEAILNSRPLTPMSSDPNDLQPLTAGHFLTGEALNCINEGNAPLKNKLVMWEKIRAVKGEFWRRWQKEYLAELQYRHKWNKETTNIKIGTMVTLKEPNLAPLQWKFGRVVKVFPDKMGIIRVVDVHTTSGKPPKQITLRRAVHEISPLPIEPYVNENPKVKSIPYDKTVTITHEAEKVKTNCTKKQPKARKSTRSSKEPVQLQPVYESRTRSGRRYGRFGSINIATIVMAIFAMCIGLAFGSSCNVTQFKNNPGLYFEEIGQLSLTNDNWNLVCYVDMNEYNKEGEFINDIMTKLQTSCIKIYNKDYCDATTGQMKHQLNQIHANNELIHDFSKNKLSRKKRGWFNGGGRVGSVVFGLMDDEDAQHYNNEIIQLKGNSDHLLNLVKNQTTMQEITNNIIRRDEERVSKQLKHMQSEIDELHKKSISGQMNVFNSLAFQALTVISGYRDTQTTLVNMVMDVYHGKIPAIVITPAQLSIQLDKISHHIPQHLMVPGKDSSGEIAQFYAFLAAKIRVTKDNIIIKINIPLINREVFKLYHTIPVPFNEGNTLNMIIPTTTYIGVNIKMDHFFMLTMQEYEKCKVYNGNQFICTQLQPLHNIQNNHTQCEMAIMVNSQHSKNNCKLRKNNKPQYWVALARKNHFLFTVMNSTMINVICVTQTTNCHISGTGIISLAPQCIIKSSSMEISAHNTISDTLAPIALVPHFNVTGLSMIQIAAGSKVGNWEDFQVDPELQKLDEGVILQKAAEVFHDVNKHDVHHYVMTYIVILLGLVITIAYIVRRKIKTYRRVRSNDMAESKVEHEVELQSIYDHPRSSEHPILERILSRHEREGSKTHRPRVSK